MQGTNHQSAPVKAVVFLFRWAGGDCTTGELRHNRASHTKSISLNRIFVSVQFYSPDTGLAFLHIIHPLT